MLVVSSDSTLGKADDLVKVIQTAKDLGIVLGNVRLEFYIGMEEWEREKIISVLEAGANAGLIMKIKLTEYDFDNLLKLFYYLQFRLDPEIKNRLHIEGYELILRGPDRSSMA